MICRLSILVAASIALALAQPPTNAANFRVPGMPGFGVARGSMFVLFGTGLGPAGLEKAQSLPLGYNLADTTVQVLAGSLSTLVPIYYTSANQVAAVLPSSIPSGEGQVYVTYHGRRSNSVAITVVDSAFGVFTRNQAGFGPGIVQNYVDPATVPTNALNASLTPGQTAVLWGTGLGPISGSDVNVPPVADLSTDAVVLVGTHSVTPDYAGRGGGFPAIDQINFKVPNDVAGCFVPVAVKAGGIVSNYVSVSIAANGGSCSDYTSYAARDIDAAAGKGESRIGQISATSVAQYDPVSGGFITASESAFAEFRSRTLTSFLAARGPTQPVPAPGTCIAANLSVNASDQTTLSPSDPADAAMLNAGAAVAVKGTLLPRGSDKRYAGSLPAGTLTAGVLAVQGGRDGVDVASFQTAITVPESVSWTNVADIAGTSIPRTKALKVTWSGGDDAREFVIVRGMSTAPSGIRGSFVCSEAIATKELTVPVDVLYALPAGSSNGPDFVEVGTATRLDTSRFDASGLDGAYVQVRRFQRAPVAFQ